MTGPEEQAVGLDSLTAAEGPGATDRLFKALTDETRRRLLAVLRTEQELSLDELTDILAGAEARERPVGPESWQRLRIRLVPVHLPMLADIGLVTYEDRTVAREEYPEAVEDVLAAVSGSEAGPESHA